VPDGEVAIMRFLRERGYPAPHTAAEWRISLDRAVEYRRADGNVSDKEKDRLTRIRL
jgi:hypothetical protein